ncbi:hypothetical protein Pla175_20930 [Pirellulimonas nuda]|uniref:DUF3352 domain-containing protein n=1 Tax=Pirellulimonas nuda TaxID=2528009 RepID=A0A518DB90_9BACT|nr:hypothetical protein [Pirellulimonas nuda]QDU88712.1 hypothetical protein Pla175_20930 [Pirellulimonas nuda]
MKPKRLLTILLLCLASAAQLHAEAPPLPSDWLAVVATSDLPALFEQAEALLGDLKRPERGAIGVLRVAASRLPLADGSVIVGLRGSMASGAGATDGVTPFALVEVSDFDLLVERLGAEPTGATAVMSLGGAEVELVALGDWALLRVSDAGVTWTEPADPRSLEPVLALLEQQTMVAAVSTSGLDSLERFAIDTREAMGLAGNRFRFGSLRYRGGWSLEQTRTLVAMAAPLFTSLKRDASAVRLGASRSESGDLNLTVGVEDRTPASDNPDQVLIQRVTVKTASGARPAIFDLPVPSNLGARRLAAGIYLASVAMQPDSVDLRAYPASFGKFASACRAAFEQVSSGRVLAISRAADSPLGANQVAALRVPDAERFTQAFAEAVARWNEMLSGAGGNQQLVFQSEPVEVGGHAGARYWANVVDPADADRVPEIKTTMQRFYGADGKASFYVVPLGADLVAVADMTVDDLAPWLERIGTGDGAPSDTGEIAVDRLINWQQQVWAAMMDGALGFKPSPPFPSVPPCEVTLEAEGPAQVFRLQVPQELIQSLGAKITAQ